MTQSNYIKIFSIIVSHKYFENEVDSSLVFKPNFATEELLHRYSIKLLQNSNGFQLFAPSQQPIDKLLEYISITDEINLFDFDILANDTNFYHYTELSLDIQELLIYSSEDELNQYENENITLHPKIVDAQNEGKLGRLQISFDHIIKNLNTSIQNEFEIRFDARSTLWQYYIIDPGNLYDSNILIKGSSAIQFNDPIEVNLKNGQKALLMTSKSLIPLSEIPTLKFDLINSKTDNNTIFSGLPNPNPKQMSFTEIDGERIVCSPMYIYV